MTYSIALIVFGVAGMCYGFYLKGLEAADRAGEHDGGGSR